MLVNALYQLWRAILSMINMCLTGKTAGFDRPRHLVLQILKNLATASRGKKKTTHLLILSIRFTKLIIHHLKTKHNIHLKSGLPLHYSHDESILNTLRYVGKDEGGATRSSKATKETLDEPSPAKRSKGGLVRKIRKPMSSLKLVDEPSAEDVPVEEPSYNEEEANLQWALELSLKEQAERTQEPARLMVIREPDSGRFQPLLEVQRKGKEKVVEEQATHDLVTLKTLKNKSHVDQFIFQRHTPMPAEASRPAKSPSLDAELALTDSETEYDDEAPKINIGDQDEGQARPNPGIQDEGQAGPNLSVQDKGQAGLNPSDAAGSQPQSSHVVHARPNLKPMDLENLKLPSKDPVIPEEPASSTRTLYFLQNVEKELSFIDQFFVEKQQEEEPGKTKAEAEVQSMVSVSIHQDTSSVPLMTTSAIDLTTSQSFSPLQTSSATTSTVMTTTTIPPPPPQP
nr:hypothetical protein [Tanacetum cinerariifolium]